jgi:hypothetical protein
MLKKASFRLLKRSRCEAIERQRSIWVFFSSLLETTKGR